MKITLIGEDGRIIGSKIINMVFSYVADSNNTETTEMSASGSEGFSASDKKNLEALQAKIRQLNPEDRIIFTQYYNTLIDNWNDLHDRTEGLLTLQQAVNENTTFNETEKQAFSEIIDTILVGDAQAVNEVSVASQVIE
jgi:hypothetical protein